jgi:membrane-associated phospholipid phosphatase
MGRRHNRLHSSYAMHQSTTTQYSLTVFDSGQWMIETRTNLDYEDGHNDHLCYATENADAETEILPTKYTKQGEKEIRWWRQQLDETGELQLKLKGIGFLPDRYLVDREVVDRHVRLDVAVCPKQVQMWLQNGWLKLKSVSGFDKALRFVELRRYVSFQNIWAECDVDLCGEKACNAGKNGPSKQFENIIFMGASLLDLECLEIHGAASMQGSKLSERYKEDNRTEDILAEHLKHMLAESLCPTGVVMISFQARYHPAFRENFKIFATQDIEKRTKDSNLQLCGENQAKMDNFYRGSNNGSLRYSFSTTYVAAEIRDGQDLSGNFAIFGKRRQWARILRTCMKCPRHWVPLTSPNGDISYVDISYVEIDAMRKEGSLCQTRDVVLVCNAGRPDCLPHWAHNKHDYDACPYGTRLPGDVTLPSRRSFTTWLSIVYGYVPVLYILLCAWRFVKTPGTRSMSILCFIAITTLFHELIVKKHVVRQPRPVGSCNTTCGMPSSHSAMAIGYLVVALMDSIFRTDTRLREKWGDVLKPKLVFPVVHGPKSFAVQIWLWCMLLLPVPLSRVVLRDHSISQVFCGGSLGFIEALLWTLLVRTLQRAYPPDQYPRLLFGKLRHNYGHPTFYREQVREKLEGKRNELVQAS